MNYIHTPQFERELSKLRLKAKYLEQALSSSDKKLKGLRRALLAEVASDVTGMSEAIQANVIAHNRSILRG